MYDEQLERRLQQDLRELRSLRALRYEHYQRRDWEDAQLGARTWHSVPVQHVDAPPIELHVIIEPCLEDEERYEI